MSYPVDHANTAKKLARMSQTIQLRTKKNFPFALILVALCFTIGQCTSQKETAIKPNGILVLMSDFGLSDRFVASMKGVAFQVDPSLNIQDLTHVIEPFNIWEAAHTLAGTIAFWPEGTVFVSVVDPGVGTERKSVVAMTQSGHFIVTPDNGTLTFVAEAIGISKVREIDENVNRRPGSETAHTFHGRDVYAYTGARLASGEITFDQVGPRFSQPLITLPYQAAELQKNTLVGNWRVP